MGSYCDRCKRKGKTTIIGYHSVIYIGHDLCDGCLKEFDRWVYNES